LRRSERIEEEYKLYVNIELDYGKYLSVEGKLIVSMI